MDIPETLQGLSPEIQSQVVGSAVNAVDKLQTTLGKILGYHLEPKHIVKMAKANAEKKKIEADAEAYKIEAISSALRNNMDLPIKYNGEQNVFDIDISDPESLLKRADIRLQYQQKRKEKNIQSVIQGAYFELGDKTVESSEEIDDDWMTRFFNIVEDISDEQLQSLWSKILAGEVIKTKTYSYRILEFLRNINKNDLSLILKIMPFMAEYFVPRNDKVLKKYGVLYSLILELDELGILNSSANIEKTIKLKQRNDKKLFLCYDGMVCFFTNKTDKEVEISFPVYAVTTVGKKLLALADAHLNRDFFKEIIEEFSSKNKNIKVSVYQLQSVKGNEIPFEDDPLYEFNKDG